MRKTIGKTGEGPVHVGIIMDGNRRYARKHGLPNVKGHERALKIFKSLGVWCQERGVKILTIYAFSSENWKRPEEEKEYLFRLMERGIDQHLAAMHKQGIRINILGDVSRFHVSLQKKLRRVIEKTKLNTKGVLNVALNYGGRWEIIEAVKSIVREKIPVEQITEEVLGSHLMSGEYPDPDLIIRTSGEQRLSNFLTWQSAYSELYFCKKYWPEFTKSDFDAAIDEYIRRERRYGK